MLLAVDYAIGIGSVRSAGDTLAPMPCGCVRYPLFRFNKALLHGFGNLHVAQCTLVARYPKTIGRYGEPCFLRLLSLSNPPAGIRLGQWPSHGEEGGQMLGSAGSGNTLVAESSAFGSTSFRRELGAFDEEEHILVALLHVYYK